MATQPINSDTVDIPSINFAQQGSDVAAPAAGRWQLFFKSGGLYARSNAGGVIGPFLVTAGGLTIAEVDGVPSVSATTLQLPNGTLSDQGGGVARYTPAQLLTIAEIDAAPSGNPTTLQFPNGTLSDEGGGVYRYTPASVSGGSNPVGARLTRSGDTNLSSGVYYAVEWATEVVDDDGFADLGTHPTRLTAPRTGFYVVSFIQDVHGGSGGQRHIRLVENGALYYYFDDYAIPASYHHDIGRTTTLYLTGGDYIELEVMRSVASGVAGAGSFTMLGWKPA